jgi:hypothetical protein
MECSVLSAPLHRFRIVDRWVSALYELEQIFLHGCGLPTTRAAPTKPWMAVMIGSIAFPERVSAITQTSTSLKL